MKHSGCPGRRGLTVVASFQPRGFNATLISGALDVSDQSGLIAFESAFLAQTSFFLWENWFHRKKDPATLLDTDFYSPVN